MTLALDGSGHANNGASTTVNVALPSGGTGRFVLLFIEANGGPVTGVTDTAGLTWTFLAASGGGQTEELWYAVDAAGASNTITVTQTLSSFITVDVLGISGADTASPFDGSAVTGSPDPLSITTSNADDFIAVGYRINTANPTAGTGFTQLPGSGADFHLVEYKIVSATQTGLSCVVGTGAGGANGGIVQAIKAAASAAAPFVSTETSLPHTLMPPLSLRNWAWSYNQNLIGKDVFPPGRIGVLYDDPSRGYLPAGQTWTWQYNPNLVAKDVFPPGRQSFERPQPVVWYREWTQNLLLSTLTVTVQRPFNQYDWPLPKIALQPDRTQVENLVLTTLFAQDRLPPGKSRYDSPPTVTWSRSWTQNLLLSTLAVTVQTPFNQYNWPLPQRAPQPDRTQVESLVLTTLLSQDALPPGQRRTETPPPVSWRRDWTQSLVLSTLIGQDQLPPGVVSSRVIVPDPWRRDWSQNLLLSTLAPVIQVPFNQYDWPLPQRAAAPGQTWTLNLLLSTLAPPVVLPFNQYDWPVPQRASQPDRSFTASFNLNLIAQDRLPFRQSDWPLPYGYYYPPSVRHVSPLNPNLFPPPPPPVITGELRTPPFIGTSAGQMMTWGRW